MNNDNNDGITIFTVLLAGNAFFWVWAAALFAARFINRLVLG